MRDARRKIRDKEAAVKSIIITDGENNGGTGALNIDEREAPRASDESLRRLKIRLVRDAISEPIVEPDCNGQST